MEEELLGKKTNNSRKLFVILAVAPLLVAVVLFLVNGDSKRNTKHSQYKRKFQVDPNEMADSASLDSVSLKMSATKNEAKAARKNSPEIAKANENIIEKVEKSPEQELENKYLLMQNKLIQEKLKRLESVRTQLDSDLSGKIRSEEQRTDKLVKVVEKMRPQAAAQFMENISSDLAISILDKLSDVKSSKIFNLMTKEKLARIGEKFVGIENENQTAKNRLPASQNENKKLPDK